MALCDIYKSRPKSGNQDSKANNKTKVVFKLNIQKAKVQSVTGSKILKISTKVKKTITKYGSFDLMLLNVKSNKLTEYAKKVKRAILKSDTYKDFYKSKKTA